MLLEEFKGMNSLSGGKKKKKDTFLMVVALCGAFQQIPAEAAQQEFLGSYFMMGSTQC